MRIRHKPWAQPELDESAIYIKNPHDFYGKWHTAFPKQQPLHLELGCGRGGFISRKSVKNPDINYLAIDIKSDMLGYANRNIIREYAQAGREIDNVRLCTFNVERIPLIISDEDRFSRLYINFCNPWPKDRHKKRRLTHSRQLENYKKFLTKDGEIWFKTDDDELFTESLEYFRETGFEITFITYDMTQNSLPDNIITEHEQMFMDEGIKIKGLIARQAEV